MHLKNSIIASLFVFLAAGFSTFAQCFQIESILVDACGNQEGLNEMVRFKVGNTALNTANLSVDWPNNSWQGLVKNATTAAKTAALNADIANVGGCGQLLEPANGQLPANARAILVTSFNMDTALNQFGPITENIYILFQNNPNVTSGHFANSGAGSRTLSMSFGSCSDTVTYDRSLLISPTGETVAADGATVLFTPNGAATYINNGCSAPVPPFTVEAGSNISACPGSTISLSAQAQGQQSVQWSASEGSFSAANNLSTNYTVSAQASGTVTLTLTATNTCGAIISDTVTITVAAASSPNFPAQLSFCAGSAVPSLATTSPNGISGSWSPSAISNTQSGTYTFTPNPNQCASSAMLSVTITPNVTPNFATQLSLCNNAPAPDLQLVSPNGISGNWNPSAISNTQSGTYTFTPNPNQCAMPITLTVTVSNPIVPDFDTEITLCANSGAPILASASPNGVSGTWNPPTIDTAASGSYTFTPDPNQCAEPVTLYVVVTTFEFEISEGCAAGAYILSVENEFDAYEWTDSNGNVVGNHAELDVSELAENIGISFPATFEITVVNNSCAQTKPATVAGILCVIPKGISPNGDSTNDNFDLSGFGVSELKIYNRYGLEVYSRTNYSNQWHGQSENGNDLPDATYYYAIRTYAGEIKTGWVYLIRKS